MERHLTWERQVKALKRSKNTKQVKVMVVVRGVLALSSGIWRARTQAEPALTQSLGRELACAVQAWCCYSCPGRSGFKFY